MPDDELLEESGVPEEETSVSDESDQEQEPSSESSADEVETTTIDEDYLSEDEESTSDLEYETEDSPEESEEIILVEETTEKKSEEELDDTGLWYFGHKVYFNSKGYPYYINEDGDKVYITDTENITDSEEFTETESSDEVCTEFEEFIESTVVVDRYQYAILENLEFIQYAHAIEIALLFLILFMRYKK